MVSRLPQRGRDEGAEMIRANGRPTLPHICAGVSHRNIAPAREARRSATCRRCYDRLAADERELCRACLTGLTGVHCR